MTDITITAPITIRRLSLSRLSLPRIGMGQSLAAIARLLGDALNLAYVAPYTGRPLPVVSGDDLEGRDPNW